MPADGVWTASRVRPGAASAGAGSPRCEFPDPPDHRARRAGQSSGLARATAAQKRRPGLARRVGARSGASAARPSPLRPAGRAACRPPRPPDRGGEPGRIAGPEDPGPATISLSAPTDDATTGTPVAMASSAASPRPPDRTGAPGPARPPPARRDAHPTAAGVGEQLRHPGPRGRARDGGRPSSGGAPTRSTPGRPGRRSARGLGARRERGE